MAVRKAAGVPGDRRKAAARHGEGARLRTVVGGYKGGEERRQAAEMGGRSRGGRQEQRWEAGRHDE